MKIKESNSFENQEGEKFFKDDIELCVYFKHMVMTQNNCSESDLAAGNLDASGYIEEGTDLFKKYKARFSIKNGLRIQHSATVNTTLDELQFYFDIVNSNKGIHLSGGCLGQSIQKASESNTPLADTYRDDTDAMIQHCKNIGVIKETEATVGECSAETVAAYNNPDVDFHRGDMSSVADPELVRSQGNLTELMNSPKLDYYEEAAIEQLDKHGEFLLHSPIRVVYSVISRFSGLRGDTFIDYDLHYQFTLRCGTRVLLTFEAVCLTEKLLEFIDSLSQSLSKPITLEFNLKGERGITYKKTSGIQPKAIVVLTEKFKSFKLVGIETTKGFNMTAVLDIDTNRTFDLAGNQIVAKNTFELEDGITVDKVVLDF